MMGRGDRQKNDGERIQTNKGWVEETDKKMKGRGDRQINDGERRQTNK